MFFTDHSPIGRGRTPELTSAPHEAFNIRRRKDDGKEAIGASG